MALQPSHNGRRPSLQCAHSRFERALNLLGADWMKERKRPPKSLVTQLDEALARFIQIDPKDVADEIEKMRPDQP